MSLGLKGLKKSYFWNRKSRKGQHISKSVSSLEICCCCYWRWPRFFPVLFRISRLAFKCANHLPSLLGFLSHEVQCTVAILWGGGGWEDELFDVLYILFEFVF